MKKYTIISGIIIFFLAVVSLLITPIIAPKHSVRAESFPFGGNVWFQFEGNCPDPEWLLYIKSVKIKPPGWSSGWHYEFDECYYRAQASGAGTYRIYAELRYNGQLKASGDVDVEYDGVHGVLKDIFTLPEQVPE